MVRKGVVIEMSRQLCKHISGMYVLFNVLIKC